jgi:hypothetical protein
LLWKLLAHLFWVGLPSMSANLNPRLPVPCSSDMLFNCSMETPRSVLNYATDLKGYFVTHLLSTAVVVAVTVGVLAAESPQQPKAQRKISNEPPSFSDRYVGDDPQMEVSNP